MVEYAEQALGHIAGATRADLDSNLMLADALVRCIEVVGEAAAQVTQDTRDKYPSIPWRAAVGMRHRLIHSYFEVDLDRVWKTATNELEPLIRAIREAGVLGGPSSDPDQSTDA
jgi:uncharacterized protein with HEPN domain